MTKHNNISQDHIKFNYRSRHLPHMFNVDKPMFITYRMNFTLPKPLLDEYNRRRTEWHIEHKNLEEKEKVEALEGKDARFFQWFDDLLAKSAEVPQILHRDDLTAIISESLKRFDGLRYKLLAYCIMPNHLHVLVYPLQQAGGGIFSPQHMIYTWKKFTATEINKILDRKGSLWHKENYDRMIRDEEELNSTVNYIVQNPVKAGLVKDWRHWSGTFVCADFYRD